MNENRLNIGFFTCHLNNDYAFEVCKGVEYAAREADVNLVIFPGMYLNASYNDPVNAKYDYQYNSIFYYASKKNLDAIIVSIGSIGSFLSVNDMQSFLSQFDLPILTIEVEVPGYPYLYTEGATGMKQAVEHLIKEHGKTKIGFVSGRKENADARERLETYKSVLLENNIPVDEGKIVYGNFSEFTEEIVEDLLDRNPDLEAIVFANDQMTIGGYKVLKKRGLKIGKDILVTAYDNSTTSFTQSPTLTTVDNNIMDLGYNAIYQAINLVKDKKTTMSILHSDLVVRKSCGCSAKNIPTGITCNCNAEESLSNKILASFKERYLKHQAKSFYSKKLFDILDPFYLHFINTYLDENYHVSQSQICEEIDAFMNDDIVYYFPSEKFTDTLNMLSSYILNIKIDTESDFTEDVKIKQKNRLAVLFNAAFAHLSLSLSNLVYTSTKRLEESIWTSVYITRDTILSSSNEKYCFELIMEKLMNNGFDSAFIYLYDDTVKQLPNGWWQIPDNLIFQASNVEGKITIPEGADKFIPSSMIFHNKLTNNTKRHTLVITPLFTNEIQHGIFVCETDISKLGNVYSASLQLGTSLKFIALMKQQIAIQSRLEATMYEINDKNDLLQSLYITDELTKLYNRRGFFEQVQKITSHPANSGRKAIITFADMDNLKQVNDKFGHKDGDFALKKIAFILKASFPSDSIIARIGGDEFICFCFANNNGISIDGDNSILKATYGGSKIVSKDSITESLSKYIDINNNSSGKPYYIDISHGSYEFECNENLNIEDVMILADKILYEDKLQKRKSVLK